MFTTYHTFVQLLLYIVACNDILLCIKCFILNISKYLCLTVQYNPITHVKDVGNWKFLLFFYYFSMVKVSSYMKYINDDVINTNKDLYQKMSFNPFLIWSHECFGVTNSMGVCPTIYCSSESRNHLIYDNDQIDLCCVFSVHVNTLVFLCCS